MPLLVSGAGSKSRIGRPNGYATSVSTQRMQGISIYEPTELVIGALSGTPLSEINETLATQNQMLPFEPMDYRPILGGRHEPTIGGIAAGNVSGPRRIMAGACRDSLIGIRLVNGCGDVVKSGGRVMKNVTGLDLVKLNCGAWGTLGVFSEVIFKVLPKPEYASSLVLRGLSDATAIAALTTALGSPFSVSAAAHLPKGVVSEPLTIIRIEGFAPSVAYGCGEIAKLWRPYGKADLLEGEVSAAIWSDVRDARWLADAAESAIWRLSLAPVEGTRYRCSHQAGARCASFLRLGRRFGLARCRRARRRGIQGDPGCNARPRWPRDASARTAGGSKQGRYF